MTSTPMMLTKKVHESPSQVFPKNGLFIRMKTHFSPKAFWVMHVYRLKGYIEIPHH
jgi:hypothetical protein